MVGDLPVTFRFNGANYSGALTNITESDTLQPGGYGQNYQAVLHVPLFTKSGTLWQDTFEDEPAFGNLIYLNGGTVQVQSIERAPDGNELLIALANPS